ncbi:MAG TPA: M14 family zinc carboxypeptidase [Gaiellaceae bacterium]|jgi:protein MpaA
MGIEILLSAFAFASSTPSASTALVGHSVHDRPIKVHRLGDPASPHKVLVVGCIHGDECAGTAITHDLILRKPPGRFDLWVIHCVNPDGRKLGVRQNGRGVDLNRNFGSEWVPIGTRWDPEYSGPRPWSEPETRTVRRLVRELHPDLTIWYHQPQRLVRAWGRSVPMARKYARFAGMTFARIRWPHGTAPNWQNHRFPGTSSFVVELPPGGISTRSAKHQASAVMRLARTLG